MSAGVGERKERRGKEQDELKIKGKEETEEGQRREIRQLDGKKGGR